MREDPRVTARVTEDEQRILQLGASIAGFKVNQFVLRAALREAKVLIEKQEALNVTEITAEAFFDAMLNPPAPTEALKKAATTYKGSDQGNGEFNIPITR